MFERYHDLAAQERAAAQPPADGGRAVEAEMEAPGADPMAELTDALRKKSEQAAAEQSDEATSFASSTVDNYKTVFHSAFRFVGPPGTQHTRDSGN